MPARLAIEAEFAPDGPRLRRKRTTVVGSGLPRDPSNSQLTQNMRMITVCPNKFSHFRVWYGDALFEDVREMQLDARTLSRPCLERGGLPVASVTKEPVEA
jgi:hypothetical protein